MTQKRNLKALVQEHTIPACIALLAAIVAVYSLPHLLETLFPVFQESPSAHAVLTVATYYGIPLLFILPLGLGWIYKKKRFFRTLFIGSLVILGALFTTFLSLSMMVYRNPDPVLKTGMELFAGAAAAFGVGFFEESVFRGLLGNILGKRFGKDSKGVWTAVIVSSLLFGSVHLLNMRFGVPFLAAFIQAVGAFACGMLLCAVYYRGGNIWALMIMHALIDFGPLFEATFTTSGTTSADVIGNINPLALVTQIPAVLIALFLLRKSKMDEIVTNLQTGEDSAAEPGHNKERKSNPGSYIPYTGKRHQKMAG